MNLSKFANELSPTKLLLTYLKWKGELSHNYMGDALQQLDRTKVNKLVEEYEFFREYTPEAIDEILFDSVRLKSGSFVPGISDMEPVSRTTLCSYLNSCLQLMRQDMPDATWYEVAYRVLCTRVAKDMETPGIGIGDEWAEYHFLSIKANRWISDAEFMEGYDKLLEEGRIR